MAALTHPRAAELLPSLVTFATTLALYASTASKHVLGGDNGEFVTLMVTGGAAHPPGYPLYVLILRALRWLPGASPAHRAALITAVIASLSVFVLVRACRAWRCSNLTATLMATMFALSPLPWHLATHAEVFALNTLIAGAILWFASPQPPLRGTLRLGTLGLLAGLGLANHHSIVLLAPLGLWGVVAAVRESRRPGRAVSLGFVGLLVGILPYAYLLGAQARSPWTWGDTQSLQGLLFHFRRGEYGSTQLTPSGAPATPLPHVLALLRTVVVGLLGIPLVALFWGAVRLFQLRSPAGIRRPWPADLWPWLALLTSALAAGPLFVSLFNIPLEGVGLSVIQRFHVLPMLLVAPLVGAAVDRLVVRAPARAQAALWLLVPLAAAVQGTIGFHSLSESHRPTVDLYARNVLAIAPPSAVLVGNGDHRLGAFLYAKHALGLRADFEYVDAQLLLNDWYRARVSRTLGVELPAPVNRSLAITAVTEVLLATGRPVLFTNRVHPKPFEVFPTYPMGPLIRIVPGGERPPEPAELLAANLALSARMVVEAAPPVRGSWGAILHEDYARPYVSLKSVFLRLQDKQRFEVCWNRIHALAPWLLQTSVSAKSAGED